MSEPTSVHVVGAGAAGLMAALSAAAAGARVTVLESTDRPGTKILMSGGTRCNVTHDFVEAADYYGGSRNVVARLLREFSHEDAARFFGQTLGVELKREDTGKLFPATDDAQTVLDALLGRARALGVAMLIGRRVETIASHGMAGGVGAGFVITTSAGVIEADRVILATGGLSHPSTGSDGTGYALARAFGHTIVPTTPALTPLVARSGGMHERLRGVTLPVELTVRVGGKRAWRGTGSFLFAHFGYSGPVVLDASRHVARAALDAPGAPAVVVASFLPGESEESIDRALLDTSEHGLRRTVLAWLRERGVPERLVRELLAAAGCAPDTALPRLTREERRAIARAVAANVLPVLEVMGYKKAEVTAGGVALEEVDPRTLESRLQPGLYFVGEILDVDGRLGGYNFQWAWSTGWVAGRAAALGRT